MAQALDLLPVRLRAVLGTAAATLALAGAICGSPAAAADAPAASSATSAGVAGVDPATVRAANVAADAYLASQPHGPPPSDDGERAMAGVEAELLIIRGLLADQHSDAAGTHYLAATKALGTLTAGDRAALGARFRRAQNELAVIAQSLLGSSAVDPASHPAVAGASASAAATANEAPPSPVPTGSAAK